MAHPKLPHNHKLLVVYTAGIKKRFGKKNVKCLYSFQLLLSALSSAPFSHSIHFLSYKEDNKITYIPALDVYNVHSRFILKLPSH